MGVLDAPGLTLTKAAATYFAPTTAISDFLAKVRSNTNPTSILIIGDSTTAVTGTVDQTGVQVDSWGERFPAAMAAQFPNNPISTRWYNDTSKTYDTASVLNSSGTGQIINLWMGAVPGKDTRYPIQNYTTLIIGTSPDLVLFAHGHNENNIASGANQGTDQKLRDTYIANLEQVRSFVGGVPIVLLSQNPAPAYIPGFSERRADIYRRIAAERGYGFIDICAAFYADGRSITNTLVMGAAQDGVGLHPSNAGAQVWLAEVMKHFTVVNRQSQQLRSEEPAFFTTRSNFLTDGIFNSWTGGTTLNSWTPTNLTLSQQSGTASLLESKSFSAKLVKTTASSTAKLVQTNSMQAKMLAGRDITFAVRLYIPTTGNPQTAGRLSMTDGTTLTASDETHPINDQWHWKMITAKLASGMTILTCNIQVDPNGTTSNEIVYVDRATVVLGRYPSDAY